MDNPNPILYSDLVRPDSSITDLIAQLEELIKTYDGAKAKIQGAATEIAKGLQGVSGATEEQRKAIQASTEQVDKLVTQYRDISSAQWKAKQAFTEATAAKRESLRIDKLITQINTSAEGSYNKISAQYRLIKIRLDEMSLAEREGTEAGRQLQAEAAALYEEMKRLQAVTGMNQLNVGNYADAAKGLRQEIMSLTQQMAVLKMNGEGNSAEYRNLAERAGKLKDAMADAQREVKGLASDTQALNTVMGAATTAGGAMSAYVGALNLFGANSQSATKAQKTLGGALALVSGLTAIQNNLQKESNLMTGIATIQTMAQAKAEAYRRLVQIQGTAATWRAVAAQKAFNLVANANPYVLLATALITVIGAIAAFSIGASKAAERQQELNATMQAHLELLYKYEAEMKRVSDTRIKSMQDELEVAKARKASMKEIEELEDKIYRARLDAFYKNKINHQFELNAVEANRKKLFELYQILEKIKVAQAKGDSKIKIDVDLDGKIEKVDVDKALDAVQGQIDIYERKVKVAIDLQAEGADLKKQRQIQLEQRKQDAEALKKAELDAVRSAQDARIALIQSAYGQERAKLKAAAERQLQDIKYQLKTETNLTLTARKALQDKMRSISEKYKSDLQALNDKYYEMDLEAQRTTEDMQIELMEEGVDKQRKILQTQYARKIDDITRQIATEKGLSQKQIDELLKQQEIYGQQYLKRLGELNAKIDIEQSKAAATRLQLQLDATQEGSQQEIDLTIELMKKKRDIELAENAQLAEDVRQNEDDINAKWNAEILKKTADMQKKRAEMILQADEDVAQSEFDLLDRNERQKEQFSIQMEIASLEKILELNKKYGNLLTEQEVKTMENTIASLKKEASKMPYNNLYEMLGIGLDKNQQDAINTALDSIKSSVNSLVDSWNAAAEAAVRAADAQVEGAQRSLDAEIEARNNGYANSVESAQKELDLKKKEQEKAIKEQQKAQKAQLAIDTITQTSSLITATANIWKALGGVPIVGPALAIAAITSMWGTFAAAKIKAAQVAGTKTEKYAEGTVELLQGGSHMSGHDIDLGTKKDGTRRRAEGGEFLAVINKRNSRRFRDVIPDVIKSFNNGTFADRYQRANANMAGYALGISGGTDITGIERDVAAIRKQGDASRYVDGQGNTIIRYKNLTRKITN